MKMQIALSLVLIALSTSTSLADCTSPVGVAGQLQWISSATALKYCNGTAWIDTSSTVVTDCVATDAGKLTYTSSEHRYCNGTKWLSLKSTSLGTSCTAEGKLEYDTAISKYKGCMGTTWYDITAASGTSSDSTVCQGLLQGSTCDANALCETGSLGCYAKCDYTTESTCEGDPACNWDAGSSYCLDPNAPMVTPPGGGGGGVEI